MKLPVVAIVGRPNVGKSTFFNRMIRRRQAIVHDEPGVTRDRHYATSDWSGRHFMMIDTGGYIPESSDLIDAAIREQVEIAVEEADAVILMTDAITGITDIDNEMAAMLRRAAVPVLLVVNKVDHEKREADIYEFYNLGLGDPHPISSAQGYGIGDMLDELIAHLPEADEQDDEEDRIKLAVIGKENVGKSSFVNTLLGRERVIVTPVAGTTRDPIDSDLNYQNRKYLLIDTAGLKRKAKVQENVLFYSQLRTMRSIERADVVLCFVDASEGFTRQDARVISEAVQARKGVVIAINKWDLIEKDNSTMKEWELDIEERLGENIFIPRIYTSVTEKQRLFKLLDLATEVYEESRKEVRTRDLNDFFQPLIHRNSPPAVRGKEIKINYITQLKAGPPIFGFFCNHPKLIPDNYRRFLENQLRANWGFKGVPLTLVFKDKHRG